MPPPTRLCTAPPDMVMSDAEMILTSSAVASDADMTAAWSTSSAEIWIGLILSELHAAASAAAASANTRERFMVFPSLIGRTARQWEAGCRGPRFDRSTPTWAPLLRDREHT